MVLKILMEYFVHNIFILYFHVSLKITIRVFIKERNYIYCLSLQNKIRSLLRYTKGYNSTICGKSCQYSRYSEDRTNLKSILSIFVGGPIIVDENLYWFNMTTFNLIFICYLICMYIFEVISFLSSFSIINELLIFNHIIKVNREKKKHLYKIWY